jgi:hypothetical protein
MLLDNPEKIVKDKIVYVNVTWQIQKDNERSKCLCECHTATSNK